MDLSLATHFSQGRHYSQRDMNRLIDLLDGAGADAIRDAVVWRRVEEKRGTYDFSDPRDAYIDRILTEGLNPIVTLMPQGNPLYDGGDTVTSARGIAAFADFVASVLDRFPDLNRIAIGNEFNTGSEHFIRGKAATSDLAKRAEYYTAILQAVHERLSLDHPDVQIIGGALHSVPTGYVGHLAAAGAFGYMDALDVHPYGTDPVQAGVNLAELNRVLNDLPKSQCPDLIATEFGQSADPDRAASNPDYLAKMVAVMGDAGFDEAVWYALLDEDSTWYGDMGLYDSLDRANPLAKGFAFVAEILDRGTPQRLDAGPGVELYRIGPDTWMVWGSHQAVDFAGSGLVFRNALGERVDRPEALSDSVVIIEGRGLRVIPEQGDGAVIADSFYDFSLDPAAQAEAGWSYHALKIRDGAESLVELTVMPGQSRMNENWNPYLGHGGFRPFHINGETLMPTGYSTSDRNERSTLERFTADQARVVDVVGSWQVDARSTDGIVVEIRLNGRTLAEERVHADTVIALRDIALARGDTLDFIVHDGGQSRGDVTARHIRILDNDPDQSVQALKETHVWHDRIEGNETTPPPAVERPTPEPLPDPAPEVDDPAGLMRITGTGGRDRIKGGQRDDWIVAGKGDDVLNGGGGDDWLDGGAGSDRLKGGKGADRFVFGPESGTDRVLDFDPHQGDVLDLTAFGVNTEAVRLVNTHKGQDLQVQDGGDWDTVAELVRLDETLNAGTLIDRGTLLI